MITLIENSLEGHREEYISVFTKLISDLHGEAQVRVFDRRMILSRELLFFMMIEENTAAFIFTALVRTLFGKRTVGLLFRPEECVHPRRVKHRAKRLAFRLLKLSPHCAVITILPFTINQAYSKIADYGIYDPQLWDLNDMQRRTTSEAELSPLISEIEAAARGRKVCVALGRQNFYKGFPFLCKLWLESEEIRNNYLFVSCGRIDDGLAEAATAFARSGGLVVDRLLTDVEMSAVYNRADLIWSCYPPEYNQASGIFGRAVQYGTPSIVRTGSNIHALAETIKHPIVGLTWNDSQAANAAMCAAPRRRERPKIALDIETMRASSLTAIARALLSSHPTGT